MTELVRTIYNAPINVNSVRGGGAGKERGFDA